MLNRKSSRRLISLGVILTLAMLLTALPTVAQSYSFTLDEEVVHAFWQEDGTLQLEYIFVFTNDPGAPPIEFVDVGMHNNAYDLSNIVATVNGQPITHIADSEYVDDAFELGLGTNSIRPGQSGTVAVTIWGIPNVLYEDTQEDEYASARFSPSWFGSDVVHGNSDITMVYHLPPGVQPEEPRWHASPSGWPESPSTGLDDDGRVVYTWRNPTASGSKQYEFGASFPLAYVPEGSIVRAPAFTIDTDALFSVLCMGGVLAGIIGLIGLGTWSSRRRKLDYLPPKISIEGHGIKRGLTAVEAAVLLERPLDRVLTMILFSLIKKEAARVVKEDPLTIEIIKPLPKKMREYEKKFLTVMTEVPKNKRRSGLQKVMIALVKSVQKKMEGFSLKETREYYKSITEKAWAQVESAETPEVKSEKFGESIEWTLLDDKFDDRTRRTFQTGPMYLPPWWWSYAPSTPRPSMPSTKVSAPLGGSRTISMPSLPGATAAASVVNGVQNTASNLVSNVVGFTNGVTKTTNPPPVRTSSGGFSSGGGGCACACACAGCACACAGGGR